jgi:hypothetical protein
VAPGDVNRVNAPALIDASGIAGHPPAKSAERLNRREVHHGRDEAFRVAAPSLTASNWTTPIRADCAVVTAHHEATASGKNVLECVSAVSAEFQHPAVETEVRIWIGGFKIEVLPEGQTWGHPFEKSEL